MSKRRDNRPEPAEVVVTFFVPDESDLSRYERMDPDRDWMHLKHQRRWTVQSYLRLARAGLPVRLSGDVPAKGLVVFHSGQKAALARRIRSGSQAVLVGIRGDRREALIADYELLQNGKYADDATRFFVPYWPQPGLIPRDPARGTEIRRASFKGFDANLHPGLRSREWIDFLESRGIAWEADSMDHALSETGDLAVRWHDYREVDLVVALRPPALAEAGFKPATKLYNAWHAGVPAILGPEYAFRELRRSDLDYLEASSPAEVRAAIDRLRSDSGLYRAMVDRGRERAAEFSVAAIVERWREVLFGRILPEVEARSRRPPARAPLVARLAVRRVRRWLAGRPAR